eukprot:5963175-Pyramimonas_sp.AAC.1
MDVPSAGAVLGPSWGAFEAYRAVLGRSSGSLGASCSVEKRNRRKLQNCSQTRGNSMRFAASSSLGRPLGGPL